METIVFNFGRNVRHAQLEGQDHLVVPMVMLTEGVHNGSNGPLFYPSDELGRWAPSWNYKPIVVYHPEKNGKGTSACEPNVLNTRKVGVVLNTQFKDGKLRAEAWLNVNSLKRIDKRILNNIENGKLTEVSTGLWTENEEAEGEHNGEKYKYIARMFKPDHLAILPDLKGACSIDKGAGLLQLNMAYTRRRFNTLAEKEQAAYRYFAGKRRKRPMVSNSAFGDLYIRKFRIETQQDLNNAARLLTNTGETKEERRQLVTLGRELGLTIPKSLLKKDVKVPVGNTSSDNPQESTMKTVKEYVDHLITNGEWEEGDRDALTAMIQKKVKADPKFLSKVKIVENDTPDEDDDDDDAPDLTPPKKVKILADITGNEGSQTEEEWLATAPPSVQAMVRNALAAEAKKKAGLVATITANKRNKFTKEYLETQDIEVLEGIAAMCAPAPVANFSGAAGGVTSNGEPFVQKPLGRPVMNLGNPKDQKKKEKETAAA